MPIKKGSLAQKAMCVVLAFMVFIIGCGGSAPHPVDRYMPGDEKKSCSVILAEINEMDNCISAKDHKIKERDTWNAVWFVTGCFVIVPWFFIDCKDSYEVEKEACKERKANLKMIYADKNCSITESAQSSQ